MPWAFPQSIYKHGCMINPCWSQQGMAAIAHSPPMRVCGCGDGKAGTGRRAPGTSSVLRCKGLSFCYFPVGSASVKSHIFRRKDMLNRLEHPQIVETSRNTALISFIIGWAFVILSASWIFLFFHPAFNDYDDLLRILNFGGYFALSALYFTFYFSYSKPNLFLHWDRLIIHCFHSKGEIQLKNVAVIATGYRIPMRLIRRNQTLCLNNMYTRKNKILI